MFRWRWKLPVTPGLGHCLKFFLWFQPHTFFRIRPAQWAGQPLFHFEWRAGGHGSLCPVGRLVPILPARGKAGGHDRPFFSPSHPFEWPDTLWAYGTGWRWLALDEKALLLRPTSQSQTWLIFCLNRQRRRNSRSLVVLVIGSSHALPTYVLTYWFFERIFFMYRLGFLVRYSLDWWEVCQLTGIHFLKFFLILVFCLKKWWKLRYGKSCPLFCRNFGAIFFKEGYVFLGI